MNRLASIPHLPLWLAICGLLLAFHPLLRGGSLRAADMAITSSAVADPAASQLDEGLALWAFDQLQEGAWPAWFRHRGFGLHLPRNGAASVLHPMRAPLALGGADGLEVYYLLRLVVALVGVYILALSLGLRPESSAIAGLCFALSPPLLRQLHLSELDAAVLLPWFFVTVDWLGRARTIPALVALAGAGLGLLLGGGLSYGLAAIVGTGAFGWFRRRRTADFDTALVWAGMALVFGLGFELLWTEGGTSTRPAAGLWSSLAGLGFDRPFASTAASPALAHAVPPLVVMLASVSRMGPWLWWLLLAACLSAVLGTHGRAAVILTALVLSIAVADGLSSWGACSQRQRQRGWASAALVLAVSLLGVVMGSGFGLDWGRILLTLVLTGLAGFVLLEADRRRASLITALSLCVMAPLSWGQAEERDADRPAFVRPLLQRRLAGGRFLSASPRPDLADCVRYGLSDLRPWPGASERQDRFYQALIAGGDRAALVGFSGLAAGASDLANLRYWVGPEALGYPVETRESLPLAFFPMRTEAVTEDDALLERVVAVGFDPKALSLIESERQGTEVPSGTASIAKQQQPGEFLLRAQCSTAAWLYLALEPGPWLIAEVDGDRVPLVRANYVGAALWLPRGRHEVRLFADPSFAPGWWPFLLALAGICWGIRRMRRNPEPGVDRGGVAGQTVPPQLPHGGYSSVG